MAWNISKALEYFYFPLVHRRVTPSIKFTATHIYTWLERGTVRVNCLFHEHNTMSLTRALGNGLLIPKSGTPTTKPQCLVDSYFYMFCHSVTCWLPLCLLIIVLFLFATNRVAKKKKENMMNEENLSIVFGPTLMRAPDSDSIDILNDMKCQRLVIENLITCQDVLFESWWW